MFKKKVFLVLALVSALTMGACSKQVVITADSYREDNKPALAVDGDVTTGWISKKKASEDNCREVVIDFGAKKTFSKVVLDDSFSAGVTNEAPAFVKQKVGLERRCYNCTSFEAGTAVTNLVDDAQDVGWRSSVVPTVDAPQAVYFSLTEPISITKLELNNDLTSTSLKNFKVYYSAETLDRNNYSNKENYTPLFQENEGMDTIVEHIPAEAMTIGALYVEIYEQENEDGDAVVASLDKVYFYEDIDLSTYKEDHFPVSFMLMFSTDGVKYTTESDETENYKDYIKETYNTQEVYEKTLSASVTCRYVKYLVFEESNNNCPSIGEIRFE